MHNPLVELSVAGYGVIVIEVKFDLSPETAQAFMEKTVLGSYDGTIVHQVVAGFSMVTGLMKANREVLPRARMLRNEATLTKKNKKYAVSMARGVDPHTARNEFFINLKDNPFLDHHAQTPGGWGYCPFAQVVEGFEIVDAIGNVPVQRAVFMENRPFKEIVIETIREKALVAQA